MTGFGSLITHRPTCLALCTAGGVHLASTAAGYPGWPCPFRAVTGLPCPGCGLTRACVLFLSGDLRSALSLHAFAPLAVAGLLILSAGALLPSGPRGALVRFLARFDHSQRFASITLVALLAYWIGRLVLDATV